MGCLTLLHALTHLTSYPTPNIIFGCSSSHVWLQWRKQDAQAIKDDIRTYMDMHEDTARWLADG